MHGPKDTPASKMQMRPSSFGLCAVSRTSRSRLCLAGLSAYAKRFFRAGRPVGHSAKFLCEIGLKTPSKIDEKTSDVGLLGGVESSVWSSERPAAVLLGFWAAFEATSWGSR